LQEVPIATQFRTKVTIPTTAVQGLGTVSAAMSHLHFPLRCSLPVDAGSATFTVTSG
jgi:hypothetical protein